MDDHLPAAVGSLKVFFVVHNRAAQTALEVRSLADNRVLAKAPFVLSDDVTEASLTVDENIFWLTLHVSETDASYVKVTYNKGTWSFLKARFQTDSRGAQLVMDRDSHSAYIIEGAPISDEKVGIKVKSIGNNGEINRNDVVEFDVKGGLESWSATNGRGEVLVAMITGDSMVGQSTMHIAALNIKQEVPLWGWRKELLMPDIHVSEPVWIESPSGGAMLTLMKWLDGEATIGLYRVASGVLKTFPDQGVHRKGSIVTSGFMELGQKRVTTIIRHREGELWKFELCSGKI